VRSVGGVEYGYELVGEGEPQGIEPVAAQRQRRALELALETLRPEFLELPASIRSLVPPRPPGSPSHRELQDPGALLFDPVELAAGSIELTLGLLLDPVRAARLAEQARRDPRQLSWEEVVAAVVERTAARSPAPPGDRRSIREALRTAVVGHLMRLAADVELPARVREPANRALHEMEAADEEGSLERDLLLRFFEDPRSESLFPEPARIPPGSPIGCGFGG
jgi:hypothetical protein